MWMDICSLQHGEHDHQHYQKILSNGKINSNQGSFFCDFFFPLKVYLHTDVKTSCFHQKLFSSWASPVGHAPGSSAQYESVH